MSSRQRYLMLDGMRGLAALVVILEHADDLFGKSPFALGYLAVDFFFAISGFVIAASYDERLRQGLGTLDFLRIRLIRFYPLYALGTLIGIVAALLTLPHADPVVGWQPGALLASALYSAFMLPSLVTPHNGPLSALFPLNPPAWSLFSELLINVIYARFFFRLGNDALYRVMLLSLGWLVFNAIAVGNLYGGSAWPAALEAAPRVGFSFFAGVLVFRCRHHFEAWGPRIPGLLLAAMLVAALTVGPSQRDNPWLSLAMVVIVFPVLVGLAAAHAPRRGQALCATLGAVSYAIYTLHDPLDRLVRERLPGAAAHAPWSGLVFLGLLLTACVLLDRYYDQPLRRWLTRRLSGKRRETAPA